MNVVPKPLEGKPSVFLTEIERSPAYDGWEWVGYRGDDGNTYLCFENGGVEELWMLIPTESDGSESWLEPRRDLL